MSKIRNRIIASSLALLCTTSLVMPVVHAEGDTTTVTQSADTIKGIDIQALDENGKDMSNGMVDIGDIITYKFHFKEAMGSERLINIYVPLDENLKFVEASDGGLITKVDGKRYVAWQVRSDDEDGVVTLKTKVMSEKYGNKIATSATIVSHEASYKDEKTYQTDELVNYIWKLPNMSVINSEDKSIANTKIERDSTAYYWIGVDNPTETEQSVTVLATLDNRFMHLCNPVQNGLGGKIVEDGKGGYQMKWNLKLQPGEHKAVGYSLYVPKLEDDVFLYSKAYVTFNDLNGSYNTKETNIVNVTLGHQVGVDEDNTGRPGDSKTFSSYAAEKTAVNINKENARRKSLRRFFNGKYIYQAEGQHVGKYGNGKAVYNSNGTVAYVLNDGDYVKNGKVYKVDGTVAYTMTLTTVRGEE